MHIALYGDEGRLNVAIRVGLHIKYVIMLEHGGR